MPINYDRINQNGWRQGSVFTVADSTELLANSTWRPIPNGIALAVDTRLITVSHSCDVVSRREHETHIEVCPALPLPGSATKEQYGHARDPRRLRLPLIVAGNAVLHDFHAPLRFSIARQNLETRTPDDDVQIEESDLYDFTYWLSLRVHRRTFPDAFDRRLGSDCHKRVRKVISGAAGAHIEGLLYSLSTFDELDDNQAYRLRVVLLAKPSSFQSSAVLSLLQTARDQIETILSSRTGIAVESTVLEGSNRMTVAQYMDFDSWGFEDVSLEADTGPPPL
jgi:hypothetical protein